MRTLRIHPLLSLINSYLIDSPQPSNISYLWNLGSLLAVCLIIQIATGVTLAMHYSPTIDTAFISVEHIMRDVNYGWLLRYLHANTASFFFLFVYIHISRGLYYGSYRTPRTLVWVIGVAIFLVMIITAFLGYVLPYGQMSLWGSQIMCPKWLISNDITFLSFTLIIPTKKKNQKIRSLKRIGPHNLEILAIFFGSLLGDGYGEKHGNGTRICFQQEEKNYSYLLWFHKLILTHGYCGETLPNLVKRVGKKGKIRYLSRFNTFTYSSLNWLQKDFYNEKGKKILPNNFKQYLTPLALAIWFQDDGGKVSAGFKVTVNNFELLEVSKLANALREIYNLKVSIIKTGTDGQYNIYIRKSSMRELSKIIKPYIVPTMYYKFHGYLN